MGKVNVLGNPDFETSSSAIAPWQCNGVLSCGINGKLKNQSPQSGSNFAYIVNQFILSQDVATQAGETYDLSYYAYAWDFDGPLSVGWTVDFNGQTIIDNSTKLYAYASAGLPSDQWPFYTHTLKASGNDVLSFNAENNTVFFLDNVSLTCSSCKSKSNAGAIAGGVIGGLLILGLASLAGFYFYRKNRRNKDSMEYPLSETEKNGPHRRIPSGMSHKTTETASPPYQPQIYQNGAPELHVDDIERPDTYPAFAPHESDPR